MTFFKSQRAHFVTFYAPAIGASTSSFSTSLAKSQHPLRNLDIPCEIFYIPCEAFSNPCESPAIIPCEGKNST